MTRYETDKKYHIVRLEPRELKLVAKDGFGLNEQDIDPIQDWTKETKCGVRTCFDTFKFRSEKQITMFLLRWS